MAKDQAVESAAEAHTDKLNHENRYDQLRIRLVSMSITNVVQIFGRHVRPSEVDAAKLAGWREP